VITIVFYVGHEAERENLLASKMKGDYESEMIATHIDDHNDAFAFHSHQVSSGVKFANLVDIAPRAAADGGAPQFQPRSSRGVRFCRGFKETFLDNSHDDILSSLCRAVKERL
jgi:hypothetical protein